MDITTLHIATIQFYFKDTVSYTRSCYYREVLQEQIDYLCKQFDSVTENIDFRCQAEGYELQSNNLDELTQAANLFMAVFNQTCGEDTKVIT